MHRGVIEFWIQHTLDNTEPLPSALPIPNSTPAVSHRRHPKRTRDGFDDERGEKKKDKGQQYWTLHAQDEYQPSRSSRRRVILGTIDANITSTEPAVTMPTGNKTPASSPQKTTAPTPAPRRRTPSPRKHSTPKYEGLTTRSKARGREDEYGDGDGDNGGAGAGLKSIAHLEQQSEHTRPEDSRPENTSHEEPSLAETTPRPRRGLGQFRPRLSPPLESSLPPKSSTSGSSAMWEGVFSADNDSRKLDSEKPSLSRTSTNTGTSVTSKRSTSPVRRAITLQDVSGGISYTKLNQPNQNIREALGDSGAELYVQLRRIARYQAVVPDGIAQQLREGIPDFDDSMCGRHDRRSRGDLLVELAGVKRLALKSNRCAKNWDYEAEWNSAVHRPLLDMAFDGQGIGVGAKYMYVSHLPSSFWILY